VRQTAIGLLLNVVFWCGASAEPMAVQTIKRETGRPIKNGYRRIGETSAQ
jgi:hypothetical protein